MENHKNSLDCSIPEYVKLDKKFLLLFSVISFPMKSQNSKSFCWSLSKEKTLFGG